MSVEPRRERPRPFADRWDRPGTPRPPTTVANPLGRAGRAEPPVLAATSIGARFRVLSRDELDRVPRVDRSGGIDLSPDGAEVAFAWDRSGAFEIYSAPIRGDRIIQLTDARSHSVAPRWSPDGRWLALARQEHGAWSLWLVDRDGEHERRIAGGGPDAAWSPDGTRLAATDGSAVAIVDAKTGETRRLAEGTRPRWSPDASTILFSRDGEIAIVPAAGGEPAPLVTREAAGGACSEAIWAPDGSAIAFAVAAGDRRAVAFASVSAGAVRRVEPLGRTPFDTGEPVWRPDGRGILYHRRENGSVSVRRAFTVSHADEAVLDLPGSYSAARAGRDSETVVAIHAAAAGGVDVVARPQGAVEIGRITRSLPATIDPAVLVEPVYLPAATGRDAVLVYLPHAEAGLAGAALGQADRAERDWDPTAQLLANRGHVVVVSAATRDDAARQARDILADGGLAVPGGVVDAASALARIERV